MGKTYEERAVSAIEVLAAAYARSADAQEVMAECAASQVLLTERMVNIQEGLAQKSAALEAELNTRRAQYFVEEANTVYG